MPNQKPMRTTCLGGVSVMWGTKLLISPVKIRIFCPKTSKFGLKFAFLPGLAGSFGALLVGWLVVVARGLYLTRHIFTLYFLRLFSKLSIRRKCVLTQQISVVTVLNNIEIRLQYLRKLPSMSPNNSIDS